MKGLSPRTNRIVTTTFAVWLTLAAVQTIVVVALGSGTTAWWIVALLQLLHAVAWTAIALGVGLLGTLRIQRQPARLAMHVAALVVVSVVDAFVRRAITDMLVGDVTVSFARTMLYYADVTTLSYILSVWIGKVVDAREAVIAQARHEIALQTQLARARLGWLQAQLQPHFLFNALGTVSELIFEEPAAAVKTFGQLGTIIRSAVGRRSDVITLAEEIDALSPYLEVQRTRFSDWLAIRLDIDPAALAIPVPPLILQPLVENSIRHGLRGRSESGEIRITGMVRDGRLVLTVRDNGVGLSGSGDIRRTGVGLSNTQERLLTLYGNEASLRLYNDDLGGAVAEVTLPMSAPGSREDDVAHAPPAGALDTRRGFVRRNPALALGLGGLVAAALWSQQSWAYLAMAGRLGDRTILGIAKDDFVLVALWTAMLPLVVALSRRAPITGRGWFANGVIHLAALSLFATLHSLAAVLYRGETSGELLAAIRGSAPITLLLYVGALAYAHRRILEDWLAERQLASARYEAGIAEAKVSAAAMKVSPASLDTAMAELERYAFEDPMRAEQTIARLGNELRIALESGAKAAAPVVSGGGRPLRGEDGVERLAVSA